ncbi:lymphocyte cytosolic protein 2a isoform X1 [Sander lucioperca]|uniref:lymphocyte cytosolic protein 2a isoform X1 n=1 Tax=Sander lucioperca TaxID=283035 RepID=UPI0016535840|nr:lymphocyte cytosolic protein 2a isoform X1 [Sander lucioperca]XP_035864764.1 lymphocyte cytosolic protein 2a isoform X1 [Sander lucioperca]XP_035864765.1 lymphocyte cytosolic protein 2a isoform X1 [Sander lucioperca]
MSSDRGPSRVEVTGWSPQQLADYLKRMGLSGCDKVVMKNSISGSRFVNLSDNDLQKFPKLHAPMISKISIEISKKEEKRGLFGKKPTPKYHEPEMAADVQGWAEDEFDDEEFEDDYESPFSGDDEGSGGDYESPNDDNDGSNDYEPPPSEPPEDLAKKLCPTLPIGDSDYIDSHLSSRGPPPAVCPRPPVSTLSAPSPRMPGESSSSRRDASPHSGARQFPPGPPQIFRGNKPGRDSGSNVSPARGPHRNTVDKPGTHPRRPQTDTPDPPTWTKPPVLPPSSTSVNRSNSSFRPPANRFVGSREQIPDEVPKHNTFPLHNKGHLPRIGLSGPPSRPGDSSLPPSVPSTGSLPHKLQSAIAEQRGSFVGSDRQSFHPSPATTGHTQELDPRWYVGKVTRGQAEGCLKQVRKDGTYLVRDSTRQLANQPFTLMVFYQDKVYNIQIRQQNQKFQLGTGLKSQESFPSVSGIIGHYSQSPLLLIDAKNRSSSQQNQCLLSDPAGYHMTGETWS